MSETNIGRNLPKTHSVKPAVDGKERAKSEETPAKPESKQQQKVDLNLDKDHAATVGRSQVKPAAKKPYVYKPGNTAADLENLRYIDEAFGAHVDRIAEKLNISRDEALLTLCELIVGEFEQPAA